MPSLNYKCGVILGILLISGNLVYSQWQEHPINCYTCEGSACASQLGSINVCSGDVKQSCVTVFSEDGISVIARGCSDRIAANYATYCDSKSDKCLNCASNGCNNAKDLSEYVTCLTCDSRTDKNCVINPLAIKSTKLCHKSCMVALYARNATDSNPTYELTRSCLDDKDLDDREICSKGSDTFCKACTGDKCNSDDLPENRSKCYKCDGDCEIPTSEVCVSYNEADQCYFKFDEGKDIVKLGCRSELEQDELVAQVKNKNLLLCDGQECNFFDKLPQDWHCKKCDSTIDENCAIDPEKVGKSVTCNMPYSQCYSMVEGEKTYRGCISELSDDSFYQCLLNGDKNCQICSGENCNKEVFPEDRMSCHKCDSLSDPNCQDKPDSPTVCSIYSENEVCSTKLVNGVTYRGCGSHFLCDDSDKQYCKICNSTNCNVANLYQNNIGYPGNWQDLPINCYTCYGAECDSSSTTLLRKCENNNLQNCVTVFSMAGKVVQRGCSDTIYNGFYDHHCDNHPDLCTYCKSSGCNNAKSLDEYKSCYFCDSTTNPNCTTNIAGVSRTRKCKNNCMTSLFPRSDESDPAYELSRSCLDDKDFDERTECESGNEKFCKACEGETCNTDQMPEERLSCLRCAGEDCDDAVETICPAYRENDACFILFDNSNSIAQMGCKSDFDSSTLTALRKKMLFCDGDNCNTYDIIPTARRCLVCNSTDDALCATTPSSLTNFNQCNDLPFTECYTRIEDGHTYRGCTADLEMKTIDKCTASGDDVLCNICNAENCNTQIYPEKRKLCYRCTSDNDENCQKNPTDPTACPIYQEDDQCGVAIIGETTNRGCSSELNCDAADRETCRICAANNCNTIDLLSNYVGKPGQWQDLPLNCYSCEGSACQTSLGNANMCDNNNLQKCETVFDSTGVVVRRGCSDDVARTHGDYCDTHSGYCQQCKSSGCNNIKQMTDYVDCVFCDTTTNANCVLNPKEITKKRKCNSKCMIALYPRSSEEDPSYELSRSCLDDKGMDDMQKCVDDMDPKCKACSEPSCNADEFPSERHSCWACRGEECDSGQIQTCVSYHPTDQCYILFDNTSSVIAMGCRSEYEHSAVTELIQTKKLLLCDGKNCNSYDSIPATQSCIVCNSAADPRCATNPNLIVNSTTCSDLPYTQCYTLINKDGDTERGCHSALETNDFLSCHGQSDLACSTCSGNNCNTGIYPIDRRRCQRCNSLDDGEKCAVSPSSSGVCPKVTENEACVTSYKYGITYRGCSSELSCDVSDKKSCRVCSTSSCNTVNLEYVAKDGEPGKWQDLPIKCNTCKDQGCKDSLGTVEVCSNNNIQNCVTVFSEQGEVIQRGCSDAVAEDKDTYCEENNDKCYRCNSNECNKATTLDDYVDCLSCDTSTNSSCVKNPGALTKTRMCYNGCMTALYPRSTEDDPSYDTIRTCLDDKEIADQITCAAGSENLCKSCVGAKCNAVNIPDDRRSCLHCSGDDCQFPREELCSGYRENDLCSLLLDEQNSIIEAGCKSDFTIDQAITLIKAKRLLLCEGDNCNQFDSLPDSQTCSLCNSKTDPNCAVKPEAVITGTKCNRMPYTQCYTRVLKDGDTERGCLSDLEEDDFYNCLIGNSTSCKSCYGEKCNNDVYPKGRRSCQICDSGNDPNNCDANPDSLSICPKFAENDVCVTLFSAGTTYRGCGSEVQCDASDRKKCRICTTDGCNTVDLARKQDDNYGKWQDLPLQCYECKDDECIGQSGVTKKCENNNEQDCSTVFSSAGMVIRRGCSDQVDEDLEEYCDANSALCFNCKSNDCNNATAISEFTNCIYCDSNKDKTCVTNTASAKKTRQCHGLCMTALYPSDSSSNPAYDLIRTCLNDKETSDQTTCNEPLCKSCRGENCNKDDVPTDRLHCYSCQNGDCENSSSELCPLYKNGDKCFIRFDSSNSVAEMGCLSSFRNQEVIDILKTKRVYICDGENCNSMDKIPQSQKCAVCDSANDVNCAINALQVGTVATCNELPYPNCYTKIAKAGTTHRGCLTDLHADDFASCILSGGENCTLCIGNMCNREVFPESRLQCYSCSSDTDEDCEELPTKKSVCPYIRDSEKCVTALGGNRTERGCSSQLLCDTTDKSTCRHCSSTGCNTLNLMHRQDDGNHGMWQELPLKCHNCTGAECANSLGPAIVCADGDQQDCMTVFDEQGTVVQRGCTFDVEDERDLYCRQNPDKCISCKSNECNDAWELNDFTKCAYCNSETDASCVTQPTRNGFATRQCRKGCMAASFTAANGTLQVIRTCLDDMEVQAQHQCGGELESSSHCSSCMSEVCNVFNYPKDRLGCHVCMDSKCLNTRDFYCPVYSTDDKCYAKYESNKVERSGCSSDIDNSVLQEWKEKNELYECPEENCNAPEKLPTEKTCIACDSSKNIECATKPSAVNETQVCSAPVSSCMVKISNTVTHRGCLTSLPYSEQNVCDNEEGNSGSTLCGKCSGEICNSKVYPSNRRSCFVCNSEKDDNCIHDPKILSVCPKYSRENQCVIKYEGSTTERGCSTDLTCDVADVDHCRLCNQDGCNIDQLDNGVGNIIANNLLPTLLVAIVGLMGVTSNCF